MTQNEAILAHLRVGNTLTPMQAYELCGTLAMHSRAAEMRAEGHPVQCCIIRVGNKRVGCYSLPESHIVRQREMFTE